VHHPVLELELVGLGVGAEVTITPPCIFSYEEPLMKYQPYRFKTRLQHKDVSRVYKLDCPGFGIMDR
jgi:hypothetical protein